MPGDARRAGGERGRWAAPPSPRRSPARPPRSMLGCRSRDRMGCSDSAPAIPFAPVVPSLRVPRAPRSKSRHGHPRFLGNLVSLCRGHGPGRADHPSRSRCGRSQAFLAQERRAPAGAGPAANRSRFRAGVTGGRRRRHATVTPQSPWAGSRSCPPARGWRRAYSSSRGIGRRTQREPTPCRSASSPTDRSRTGRSVGSRSTTWFLPTTWTSS